MRRGCVIEGTVASGGTNVDWAAVSPLLDSLVALDLACAPHVVARLVARLGAHGSTIVEVVERLTRAQRQGLLPLPVPLPAVPEIMTAFRDLRPTMQDRALLVAIAVAASDELAPLLALDGRSADQIVASRIGAELVLHAGRVGFVDERLAVWAVATTSPQQVARVHDRLGRVLEVSGRGSEAAWHRARASLRSDPDSARGLVRIARTLLEEGNTERALMVAREAAAHAHGVELARARAVAGAAAVGAGYALEATAWLGSLFPHGGEHYGLQGLAGLVIAQAHLHGSVPEIDFAALRPRSDAPADWLALARAAALAAPLCAERGDRRGLRAWSSTLREASARAGTEATLRDPALALSWLLLGEADPDDARGAGPVTGVLLRALSAAVEGRIDEGVRLLAHDQAVSTGVDPLIAGSEHSPLVDAYREVAHVLLLVWRGEIAAARDRLIDAAISLPVAIPFAGLGVVLARRLDLAVRGELGPLARGLTAALPTMKRIDLLVDQGIEVFLAGDFEGAAQAVRLWKELGAAQTAFAVPGLEEIRPGEKCEESPRPVEPPDGRLARALRERVATASDARWRSERAEVADAARNLRSAFARGRIEAMLGTRSAIRGEPLLARDHYRTAVRLFALSGAQAWERSVARRLRELDDVSPHADPLAACRLAWSQQLTSRELEVSMHAAAGASNRDIAQEFRVSVRTVEVHLGRAFAKLGVRSRVELTVLAHRTSQLL